MEITGRWLVSTIEGEEIDVKADPSGFAVYRVLVRLDGHDGFTKKAMTWGCTLCRAVLIVPDLSPDGFDLLRAGFVERPIEAVLDFQAHEGKVVATLATIAAELEPRA